jgi:hypothetical protein
MNSSHIFAAKSFAEILQLIFHWDQIIVTFFAACS